MHLKAPRTATYDNAFNLSTIDKKARYFIDLGEVKNIAEVIVNGENMGPAWKKPFRLDITEALRIGENKLHIGDAQPGIEKKITYTTMPFYQADAPLLPSGLLEPVKIMSASF